MRQMKRVVVTGMGAVTPFGPGVHELKEGLQKGRSVLSPAEGVATDDLRSSIVGEVTGRLGGPFDEDVQRCLALAVPAAKEALAQAQGPGFPAERMYVALGTGAGEVRALESFLTQEHQLEEQAEQGIPLSTYVTARLARELALEARTLTFVSACAAGVQSITTCFDLIRSGEAEMALAGGVEILSRATLAGFNTLHALAPSLCRPFDVNREGTQLGEAAAFVLLESADHAEANGRKPLAEIAGYGASSDAFHPTRCDPDGLGPQAAMSRALRDAGIGCEDIDYINAHGTATFQNDLIELNAIAAVFGEHSRRIPISSTKSQMGHSTAASGAVECVVCALALHDQFLPPTLNVQEPLPGYEDYDFAAEPGRSAALRHVMSNSFAFGGFNVCLILSRADGSA